MAARASERSHRPLTRRGYPRPLAHSQALLPGSGFTSKLKKGGSKMYISTNSPLYTNWRGELQPICTTLPLFSPGTNLRRLIGYFNDLPIGGVTKQGTPSYKKVQSRCSLIKSDLVVTKMQEELSSLLLHNFYSLFLYYGGNFALVNNRSQPQVFHS